jgi:hypothetical protein
MKPGPFVKRRSLDEHAAHRVISDAAATGAGCVDYAYCDPASQTCLARGKAGEACDVNNFSCLGALQCTTAGICALPTAVAICP